VTIHKHGIHRRDATNAENFLIQKNNPDYLWNSATGRVLPAWRHPGLCRKTVCRRTMHMDVQASREGRTPGATAAVEPTGMYLRRVLRYRPGCCPSPL